MEVIREESENGADSKLVDADIRRVLRKVDLVRSRMRRSSAEEEEDRRVRRRAEADAMIAMLGEDKVWEKFRIYTAVEKQCRQIEEEVRKQVEKEMRERRKKEAAEKKSKSGAKSWDTRIRNIKREIRNEFDCDLDDKKKKPAVANNTKGVANVRQEEQPAKTKLMEVMPSARKKYLEAAREKGLISAGAAKATAPSTRTRKAPPQPQRKMPPEPARELPIKGETKPLKGETKPSSPLKELPSSTEQAQKGLPEAITVRHHTHEELLAILAERLANEKKAKEQRATTSRSSPKQMPSTGKASNVALVHASHGCRTTSFRSRLSAHTLRGVDILPMIPSDDVDTEVVAPVIEALHEDEDADELCNHSVVEVISTVPSPSLNEAAAAVSQRSEAKQEVSGGGDDTSASSLTTAEEVKKSPARIDELAKRDGSVDAVPDALVASKEETDDRQKPMEDEFENPSNHADDDNDLDYSDNFETEPAEDSRRSGRLSTIQEASESRASEAGIEEMAPQPTTTTRIADDECVPEKDQDNIEAVELPEKEEGDEAGPAGDRLTETETSRKESPQVIEPAGATNEAIVKADETPMSTRNMATETEVAKASSEAAVQTSLASVVDEKATVDTGVQPTGNRDDTFDASFEQLKREALDFNTSSLSTSSCPYDSPISSLAHPPTVSQLSEGQVLVDATANTVSEGEVRTSDSEVDAAPRLPPRLSMKRKDFVEGRLESISTSDGDEDTPIGGEASLLQKSEGEL